MVAECAADNHHVAGLCVSAADINAGSDFADTGSIDKQLVGRPPVDDFGVAGHD